MENTTFKIASEDAYVSGLLWREEEPSLSNNYEMAKRRLQSLERKFENCPETRERYAKSIQDDIEKGYVKKLSEEEVQCDSKVTSYLPHRFVINPKKPDMLRLPDRDKPAMRFLWRDSLDEKPSVYQFERTVFGEVSAPSRANYTMRKNADENEEYLPLGVKAVYKHFYVDDGLPSTDSREEAIEMRKQMPELLRHGGFAYTNG